MNAESGSANGPARWPTHVWWGLVGLVLVFQMVLIFWLGDQGPARPGSNPSPFTWRFVGKVSSELLALTDPTLFALPHRQSFSGPAWLRIPVLEGQSFLWSEEPQWLRPSVDQLGGAFHTFLATNQILASEAPSEIEPELSFPKLAGANQFPAKSTYQVLGDLGERDLLTPLALNSWTNAELLTNSIVQVLVDASGRPVSVTLLWNSGSSEADQLALKQVEQARFQSLPLDPHSPGNPVAGLRWAQILFDWHTVPTAMTNRPKGP